MSKRKQKETRDCSIVSETGQVRWETLMRKFSDSNKVQCKTVTVDMPRVHRSSKEFPTGSEYEGTWDLLGMSGYGIYTFPLGHNSPAEEGMLEGVVYEGDFDDGVFHGEGELHYNCGAILQGNWKHGTIHDRKLIFGDGLEYTEVDWLYCRMPDRRFTIEYDHGILPAGESYLTAEQPTLEIPHGYCDTCDGLFQFDPETKAVYKTSDLTAIIRAPSLREQNWINNNCRKCPDLPLGPSMFLYEDWQEPQLELEAPPLPSVPTLATTGLLQEDDEDEDPASVADFFWRPTRASRVSEAHKWKDRAAIKSSTAADVKQPVPETKMHITIL